MSATFRSGGFWKHIALGEASGCSDWPAGLCLGMRHILVLREEKSSKASQSETRDEIPLCSKSLALGEL
jgi:hypothetical protein